MSEPSGVSYAAPPQALVGSAARWALIALLPLYPLVPRFAIVGPLGSDDVIPLVALGVAFAALLEARRPPRIELVLGLFISFTAVVSLSAALSSGGGLGLLTALGRTSGRLLLYATLVVAVRELLDARERQVLLKVLLAVAAFEGVFGVLAYAFRIEGPWQTGMLAYPAELMPPGGRSRVQGTFGGEVPLGEHFLNRANFYSAYLVIALMAAGVFVLGRRRPYAALVGMAAILGGILCSYSRMSLLAALMGLGVLAVLRRHVRAALPALALVGLVLLAVPDLRERFLGTSTDRAAQWTIALRVIADHPWLGVGDGRYLEVAPTYAAGIDVPVVRTPHNSVLYAAASFGVLGGIALVVLYGGLVVEAVRRLRRKKTPMAMARAALVAAFIGHDLTNNLFFVPDVALAFWMVWAATDEMEEAPWPG